MSRLKRCFADLKASGRKGLITFITAGHPDLKTAQALLNALPESGADVIELGMPFSDPMADGPVIQAASLCALKAGHTTIKTLNMVTEFRKKNQDTPIVLMGYFNPIYQYGPESFIKDAAKAGVDGLIIVDLPPEEAADFTALSNNAGLDFIALITPTTNDSRLSRILEHASGFIYYVSLTGVTGVHSPVVTKVAENIARIRAKTDLPIAVGFGLKTAEDIKQITKIADAAVVGSAIVDKLSGSKNIKDVLDFVKELSGY